MSMADLEQAIAILPQLPSAHFDGPKDESLVRRAEQALGVTFPPTYRLFLQRLGAGNIRSCELYGILGSNLETSGVPNAVWLTLDERRTAQSPRHLVVISDTGYGGYYAIDTSQRYSDGECPVVEWQPNDSPDHLPVIATDFGAYILELVEWALQRGE